MRSLLCRSRRAAAMQRAVPAGQHRLWAQRRPLGQARQLLRAVLVRRSVLAHPDPPLVPADPVLRPGPALPDHPSVRVLLGGRLDLERRAHPLSPRGLRYPAGREDRAVRLLLWVRPVLEGPQLPAGRGLDRTLPATNTQTRSRPTMIPASLPLSFSLSGSEISAHSRSRSSRNTRSPTFSL